MVSRLFQFTRREFVRCYRRDLGPPDIEIKTSRLVISSVFITVVMVTYVELWKKNRMRELRERELKGRYCEVLISYIRKKIDPEETPFGIRILPSNDLV
ncbi:hypothetical protein TNIN_104021 [Trichonephila inaurata madagascariensis]|uniref:Uncharacterized protein n=1 Tax=Trichonephila inaurata madagascariensis TaxID=2747483 RepID=A0A8X6XSY5_9ARAC|nr:hypothetical protein TNIN_104021 [Trichonephila inaurata madagascariensis]